MTGTFGHKWISGYGESPNPAWSAALMTLTVDQVMRGLDACLTWTKEWPPTLPEFMALCRAPKIATEQKIMPPSLPMPGELWDQRAEAAREAIAGIREASRLSEWLERHERRRVSVFADVLGAMRGMVVAAQVLHKEAA